MNTPRESGHPVAWEISYKYHDGSPRTVLCGHNSVGDYRDFDPYATSIPLSRSEYDEAMQTAYRISCATKQNTCRKCQGIMRPGQAMAQTFDSGLPDFPGDTHGITISPGGPGKLIDCMKCSSCGWSVTTGAQPATATMARAVSAMHVLLTPGMAQPVQPAEPTCGIKAGENIEQAAEGWAQWCEVRGNQMLANFLRKVAQPVPPTKVIL